MYSAFLTNHSLSFTLSGLRESLGLPTGDLEYLSLNGGMNCAIMGGGGMFYIWGTLVIIQGIRRH